MNLSRNFYKTLNLRGSFDDDLRDSGFSEGTDDWQNVNSNRSTLKRNQSFRRKVTFYESISVSSGQKIETVPEDPEELQGCDKLKVVSMDTQKSDTYTDPVNRFVDEVEETESIEDDEDELSLCYSDDSWDQTSDMDEVVDENTEKKYLDKNDIGYKNIKDVNSENDEDLTFFDPIKIVKSETKESKEEMIATLESLLLHVGDKTRDGIVDEEIYNEMENYWSARISDRRRWKLAVSRLTNLRRFSLPTLGVDQLDAPEVLDVEIDDKISARDTTLYHIANELLETEREYVQGLRHLAVTLHKKVVKENMKKPMFEEDMMPKLFLNIQSVFAFHDQFMLPKLEERMAAWSKCRRIGDVMKLCAPFLKLDAEYVRKYNQCMKDFKDLKKNCRRFRKLIERFEVKILQKQDWSSVSLQPVQRVPRYILLVQRYIDNLPEDSTDAPEAKDALKIIESVACHSNETIRKNEDANRLLEISKRISGLKEELFVNNRKFIMQDDVCVIDPRSGDTLHRQLIMFSDILLVCHPLSVINNTHRVIELLPFKDSIVIEGANISIPYTLFVNTIRITVEFAFKSQQAKNKWKKEMEKQVNEVNKKSEAKTLKNRRISVVVDTIGFRAPIYVRFKDVRTCMLCQNEFSLLSGKNHCRACGMVVCGQCSAHQIRLPYLDDAPDRVCDKCFVPLLTKLDRRRSEAVLPTYTLSSLPHKEPFKRRLATTRRTMNRTKSDWYTE